MLTRCYTQEVVIWKKEICVHVCSSRVRDLEWYRTRVLESGIIPMRPYSSPCPQYVHKPLANTICKFIQWIKADQTKIVVWEGAAPGPHLHTGAVVAWKVQGIKTCRRKHRFGCPFCWAAWPAPGTQLASGDYLGMGLGKYAQLFLIFVCFWRKGNESLNSEQETSTF